MVGCFVALTCKIDPIMSSTEVDIQGHRGCRGLLPENTIIGFKKALDLGVNTLELDLCINGEGEVIVSHEPFFNHEISTGPDGELISKDDELKHNAFKLTQAEIETYDVGLRPHPRFPLQRKVAATKPLLTKMVDAADTHAQKMGYSKPLYNMEIKRRADADNLFHPAMKVFADKVISTINSLGIADRTTVQCFDVETLQYLHKQYNHKQLVYLIENEDSIEQNIAKLGFVPAVYSPYYKLVDKEMIDYCGKQKMKLIPWTVNDADEVATLIALGVDGIISDYPDMAIEVKASVKSK